MKVTLEEDKKLKEVEVVIRYNEKTQEVNDLVHRVKTLDKRLAVNGQVKEEIQLIDIKDIFYIESVDNNTFIYLENQMFQSKQKLYELEETLGDISFLRCNKSTIINLYKIKELKLEANRTLLATMENGEKVYISRLYVKKLKEILGG